MGRANLWIEKGGENVARSPGVRSAVPRLAARWAPGTEAAGSVPTGPALRVGAAGPAIARVCRPLSRPPAWAGLWRPASSPRCSRARCCSRARWASRWGRPDLPAAAEASVVRLVRGRPALPAAATVSAVRSAAGRVAEGSERAMVLSRAPGRGVVELRSRRFRSSRLAVRDHNRPGRASRQRTERVRSPPSTGWPPRAAALLPAFSPLAVPLPSGDHG
jgi:hypothetical protein